MNQIENKRGRAILSLSAQAMESLLPISVPFEIDFVEWVPGTRVMRFHVSGEGLFGPPPPLCEVQNINLESWAPDASRALKAITST